MTNKEINKKRKTLLEEVKSKNTKFVRLIMWDGDQIVDICEFCVIGDKINDSLLISKGNEFCAHLRYIIDSHIKAGLRIEVMACNYDGNR